MEYTAGCNYVLSAILTFSGPTFASEGKYGGHLIAAFSADPGGLIQLWVSGMSHVVIENKLRHTSEFGP